MRHASYSAEAMPPIRRSATIPAMPATRMYLRTRPTKVIASSATLSAPGKTCPQRGHAMAVSETALRHPEQDLGTHRRILITVNCVPVHGLDAFVGSGARTWRWPRNSPVWPPQRRQMLAAGRVARESVGHPQETAAGRCCCRNSTIAGGVTCVEVPP